ncbi:hypothetical protein FWC63_00750 [Candidatus Saccharibacteria bacterium]|nr:hypothetical protein [Candidatus Saccharibacteria bacterium]
MKKILTIAILIMATALLAACNPQAGAAQPQPFSPITSGGGVTEVQDPISGDSFGVMEGRESESLGFVHLLGFGFFNDIGFTSQQQHLIFSGVQDFFTDRYYPEITRLSLERESIAYDVMNEDHTWFRLIADTGQAFRVRVGIEGSMFQATLTFHDDNRNVID